MPTVAVAFAIDQPAARVWQALQDVPAVAPCMPGLELTGSDGPDRHRGKVRIKLGPVSAEFEGEAAIAAADEAARTGRVEGKGIDRKGGSRTAATVAYKVVEAGPTACRVEIESNFTVTGALAQMGRVGIFQDVATQLTNQFAAALRDKLAASAPPPPAAEPAVEAAPAPPPAPAPQAISAWSMLGAILRGLLRRLIGRA